MLIHTNMKQPENSMGAHLVYLQLSDNEALKETEVSYDSSPGFSHTSTYQSLMNKV
jgi:hypothetical protein